MLLQSCRTYLLACTLMAFSRVSLTYAIIGNIGLVSTEWTTTPTSTGVNMTTVTKKYGPVDVSTPSGLVAMEEYQRTIDLLADVVLQATTPGGSRFQLAKRVLVSLNDRVDRLELAVRPREEQSTLNLSLYSEDSQAPILAVKNASLGKDWLQAREPVGKLLDPLLPAAAELSKYGGVAVGVTARVRDPLAAALGP